MADEPGTAGVILPTDGGGDEGSTTVAPAAPGYEEIARTKGWKPKEEYEGEVTSWVDAEEFVKREPLFEKIRNQSKELKEMRRTVEAMATHFQKNVKAATDRAIADLKVQRKEAIELGDAAAVDKIDEQIEEHKQQAVEAKAPEIPGEIRDWMGDNKWFVKDSKEFNEEMHDFAVAFNETYLRKHPGELGKSLEETTKAVKKAFPENFENKKRSEPSPVAGGSRGDGGGKSQYTVDRLTPEQKLVYKQFVTQHKIMSHEEYFKGLEENGDLQ